ncbi:MAG: SagB/ThcOx family dehydrogenase [Candidatus Pacearchaeota archaeon]|nr:SagB/ThcOx family dehydrogenase [Candidatus Pacearchaeota archaeon]
MLDEINKFYEKTKFFFNQLVRLPEEMIPINWVKVFYKTYPRFPKVSLSKIKPAGELQRLLEKRKSFRDFVDCPISINRFERLLYFSLGIKENQEEVQKKRFYPSAGARFPIEPYIIVNNIQNLERGVYHYSAKNNELEVMLKKDLRMDSSSFFGDDIANKNPNFIVLTGVMSRTEVKYGINAYRFALLEAGHIGQNLYLLAEKEGLGCCAIGGFDNDSLSKLLDLTEDEIPLYSLAIGNKSQNGIL